MDKASTDDLRKSMEAATSMLCCGVLFVPVPVLSVKDHEKLLADMFNRLNQLDARSTEE